jgi:hypothetical protein
MGGLRARVDHAVVRHPAVPLALRAALAALAAWLVVLPFGGLADMYAYYAPLGALLSVSTTVLSSLRTAAQMALALGLGACLAGAALQVGLPQPLALGLVIGLGTLLSAWRRLGVQGSWVPISALFILILGHHDPEGFVVGYLGFTILGAAIGSLVNMAFPPLRLAVALQAADDLRSALVDQLDSLADGLEQEPLPGPEEWGGRRFQLEPRARRLQELVGEVAGGPPVNWRVRRDQDRADRVGEHGRALVNLAFVVNDLATQLTHWERADRESVPLGPDLRPQAARTLRELAVVLRSVEEAVADPDSLSVAWREVHRLADEIRAQRRRTGQDLFAAGTLVTGLERALLSVTP